MSAEVCLGATRSSSGRRGLGTDVALVIRGQRNLHHADRENLAGVIGQNLQTAKPVGLFIC